MSIPWLEPEKTRLAQALDQGRLGHAPLICGPIGLGKCELAEWLARRILCLEPAGREPCGLCASCRTIAVGSHPDYFRVGIPEDKKAIPVDSVRQLTDSLQLTPSLGARRLGLIEPAEAMNVNAANALLKTLEEPSPNAWLILVSNQPGRLTATVRSRCQLVTVRPPERRVALEWLAANYPDQSSELHAEALSLTAEAPLAAQQLLVEEGLAFGHEVLDGLLAIAADEPMSKVVNEHWMKSPPHTWQWLAVWSSVLMRHAQGLEYDHLPGGRSLPSGLDPAAVGQLWDQALRGGATTRGNARQDLLVGKWLLEWKQIC